MIKIKEVHIQQFKGIKELHLENLKDINVFIGKNNSGKTSILEALEFFFDNNLVGEKLQNLRHYNQNGDIYGDTKISVVFEIQDIFFELSDVHKTFKKYGKEIQISRINFEQSQVNKSYEIEGDQFINENTNIQNGTQLLTEIRQIFGNNNFCYLPAIDGMRLQGRNPNYYKNYYGENNDVTLRGGMKGVTSHLHNKKTRLQSAHETEEFLERLKNFYPEFAQVGIEGENQLWTVFGEKRYTKTIPFYNQGLGEVDTFELFWAMDPISKPNQIPPNKVELYLIDQPENHKHASLERKILQHIMQISKERKTQFFICTHSPLFASLYAEPNTNVYIITRNIANDTNKAKPVLSDNVSDVRKELGLLNTDYFFSNAILFVEGDTEEKVIPALFEFMGSSLILKGSKIFNRKGSDNLKYEKMKGMLNLITDTHIVPYIMADDENDAIPNKQDIIRVYQKLFAKEDLQYHLWGGKKFVNSLPKELVVLAFNKLLKDKGIGEITEKEIDNQDLEKSLEMLFNKKIEGGSFSKVSLAEYIAYEIRSIENQNEYQDNEVFKHVKNIYDDLP